MKKTKIISIALAGVILVAIVLTVILLVVNRPESDPNVKRGTITLSLSIGDKEREALQAVIDAYNEINPLVSVNIEGKDYDAYREWLSKEMGGETSLIKADIVQNNTVSEYYTDEKFVDFNSYLSLENPYAPNQETWYTTLDTAAYRPNGPKKQVFSMSFDFAQMMFFFNEDIFRTCGLVDESGNVLTPKTWDELVDFCEIIANTTNPKTGRKYTPLTIAGDAESFWNLTMGWLIRIYVDQYFRDVTDTVHAQPGDYFYDPDTADWEYLPTQEAWLEKYPDMDEEAAFKAAIYNDAPENYAANPIKLLKLLKEGDADGVQVVGPSSPRYQDMLKNFQRVIPKYCQDGFLSQNYGASQTAFFAENAAITFAATDFFKYYYQNESNIKMGTFYAPPMTHQGTPGGEPAVNVTRALGGPQGFYGVVNKSQEQTELVMDFMMFWVSKQGQEASFRKLKKVGWYLSGTPLVHDLDVPEEINPSSDIKFMGECDLNPINLIARGLEGEGQTVRDFQVFMHLLFATSGTPISVSEYGSRMHASLIKYLPEYLAMKGYRQDCLNDPKANPFE